MRHTYIAGPEFGQQIELGREYRSLARLLQSPDDKLLQLEQTIERLGSNIQKLRSEQKHQAELKASAVECKVREERIAQRQQLDQQHDRDEQIRTNKALREALLEQTKHVAMATVPVPLGLGNGTGVENPHSNYEDEYSIENLMKALTFSLNTYSVTPTQDPKLSDKNNGTGYECVSKRTNTSGVPIGYRAEYNGISLCEYGNALEASIVRESYVACTETIKDDGFHLKLKEIWKAVENRRGKYRRFTPVVHYLIKYSLKNNTRCFLECVGTALYTDHFAPG